MRKSFLPFFISFSVICSAQNTSPLTLTAVPIFSMAPDARGSGMGYANAAVSEGSNSMHWNVSGLSFSKERFGISASYLPWLRALIPDMNHYYISAHGAIDKSKRHTLGATYRQFTMGEIDLINIMGTVVDHAHPMDQALDIGYSFRINEKHSAGIAARYIHSNLWRKMNNPPVNYKPAEAIAGDLGYTWKPCKYFSYGLQVSNIGTKLSYSDLSQYYLNGIMIDAPGYYLPMNIRTGLAFHLPIDSTHRFTLTGDMNKLLVPTPPIYAIDPNTGYVQYGPDGKPVIEQGMDPDRPVLEAVYTSFYDAPGGSKEEWQEVIWNAGFEYTYRKLLAVRGGYFHEHPDKGGRKFFTLGLGAGYKGVRLDASYFLPMDKRSFLENTFCFTLSAGFDKFPKPGSITRKQKKEA